MLLRMIFCCTGTDQKRNGSRLDQLYKPKHGSCHIGHFKRYGKCLPERGHTYGAGDGGQQLANGRVKGKRSDAAEKNGGILHCKYTYRVCAVYSGADIY